MLQRYVPPSPPDPAEWVDTATRYVELKPRRNSDEIDPVASWAVRHMKGRQAGPFRVMVKEYNGRICVGRFVVHIDGTRTPVSD
jgi:hypothetical protein